MAVQATDAQAQSSAQSSATAALGANLQAFAVNMSVQFGAVAAATAAGSDGCISTGPYVEFDAGNGVCRRLNYTCDLYAAEHYEHTPPTRTSDRVCRPRTICSATQFMTWAGSAIENSACTAVTNCTATGQLVSVEATATTDAVCIRVPGTQTNPGASCLAIKQAAPSSASGYFWIRFGSAVHQTYCHMTHEGAPHVQSSLLVLSVSQSVGLLMVTPMPMPMPIQCGDVRGVGVLSSNIRWWLDTGGSRPWQLAKLLDEQQRLQPPIPGCG